MHATWNWKPKKLNNDGFWNKSMVIGCCCLHVEEENESQRILHFYNANLRLFLMEEEYGG